MKDKEAYIFRNLQGFRTIRMNFSAEAVEWLGGTTRDDGGNVICNRTLFCDLLSRMRLTPGRDASFRRPQELEAGQFQFSETCLAQEWNIGRKKLRNLLAALDRLGMVTVSRSKVASVASVTCIEGWTDLCGNYVGNPCNTTSNTASNGI